MLLLGVPGATASPTEPSRVEFGAHFDSENVVLDTYVDLLTCFVFFVTLMPYVGYLDCRCFITCRVLRKTRANALWPIKTNVFTWLPNMFCAFLAAERLGKEGTRSKKQDQNKAPKRVTNNKIDRFSNLSNVTSNITWQNGLPESPRELPGTSWTAQDGPKKRPERPGTGPGAAKSAPRAARKRFRSGLGGQLAPTCRPEASTRPF